MVEIVSDQQFMQIKHEIERAANNIKNELRSYNFHDYIEKDHDIKSLKAKSKVLHDMVHNMANNRIAMMGLAMQAVDHRAQLIKQIGENPHVKEQWDDIMMALMMVS